MTFDTRPPICIACSIFRKEIEALQASHRLEVPVEFLTSMLHMVPSKLESRLQEVLAAVRANQPDRSVVIAYGDCCSRMEAFESAPGASRTEGLNCCEILLGRDAYRKLRREGAFFLMPEWALSWKQVFVGQLGPCAKTFMQEMHTRLVYLDTGILPVPHQDLEEASRFLGLPVEVLPVSLDPLLASLNRAMQAVRPPDAH